MQEERASKLLLTITLLYIKYTESFIDVYNIMLYKLMVWPLNAHHNKQYTIISQLPVIMRDHYDNTYTRALFSRST